VGLGVRAFSETSRAVIEAARLAPRVAREELRRERGRDLHVIDRVSELREFSEHDVEELPTEARLEGLVLGAAMRAMAAVCPLEAIEGGAGKNHRRFDGRPPRMPHRKERVVHAAERGEHAGRL
jgi:hypothetical protein